MILVQYDDDFLQELSDNCLVRPEGCTEDSCAILIKGSPACDPFITLDFYERTLWENLVWLVALVFFYRFMALVIINWTAMDFRVPYSEMPKEETFEAPFHRREYSKIL